MKILSDASYALRISQARDHGAFAPQTDLYRLGNINSELCEKNARLSAHCRAAERRVQELTLLLGMKGFAVEMTPDIPATPAKPGVLTLTKISK